MSESKYLGNMTVSGMKVIYKGPKGEFALMTDTESGWFGWLFFKHADGQWVSMADVRLT